MGRSRAESDINSRVDVILPPRAQVRTKLVSSLDSEQDPAVALALVVPLLFIRATGALEVWEWIEMEICSQRTFTL